MLTAAPRQTSRLTMNILILDTPNGELGELSRVFRTVVGRECEVHTFSTAGRLLGELRTDAPCDLIVVDYFIGDGDRTGLEIMADIRAINGNVPMVAVGEQGDVESAANAIRAGATDFLVRGHNLRERVSTLLGKARQLFRLIEENRRLAEVNESLRERYRIVGKSPQVRRVLEQIERVARVPRPVLIVGERGTGKELMARAIHEAASDASRPLVAVNCAALAESLLESELFGHEKGAFTGADSVSPGKFEQARDGTLFLDEIGNMSRSCQQKILRVVEYGTFTRVGGNVEIETNARIIAATNSDLEQKMEAGEFLPDLYDRLSFEVIRVPPLREREGDVDVLAQHFLDQFAGEIPAFRGKSLAPQTLALLRQHAFPGNVRELKNIIERGAYRDTTNEITPEDIGMLTQSHAHEPGGGFGQKVEAYKKHLILTALERAEGIQAQAARSLGLSYHQYRYFLGKYRS